MPPVRVLAVCLPMRGRLQRAFPSGFERAWSTAGGGIVTVPERPSDVTLIFPDAKTETPRKYYIPNQPRSPLKRCWLEEMAKSQLAAGCQKAADLGLSGILCARPCEPSRLNEPFVKQDASNTRAGASSSVGRCRARLETTALSGPHRSGNCFLFARRSAVSR
jgi:hypothetical protein